MSSSREPTVSVLDPTDDSIFTAGLDDVTSMSKILHELFRSDDHSILVITRDGVRIISAGEKTFQVSAFFAAKAFQRFKFDHESHLRVNFRFILRDFIECLSLLRDDPIDNGEKQQTDDPARYNAEMMKTSLYIQYRNKGDPLKLRLENKSNYVIDCDLKGFSVHDESFFSPLAFYHDEETAVILLNSRNFYDYISGLDLVTSDYVHLIMGRGDVPIKMSTRSTLLGEVELEITSNETSIIKRGIVVSDNCLFSFSYRTKFMKPALEALRTSSSMQMKCGSSGLLCIEHFHKQQPPPPDGGYVSENSIDDIMTDYNLPQNKRSSVEYFILSEAKPIDACID